MLQFLKTEKGRVPLWCDGLDDAPNPRLIVEKYSAALGDVFHAMNRTKVPVMHEAKKAFFVALREAFLVWNPTKMKELETKMREQGMSDNEIQAQKYFNSRLFRECIDRVVPPPQILYWRVRAVYALYGPMIDSKTKKPLFTPRAWKKANNVLKEILDGYYSDPPGLELYTKKLGKSGAVLTNKYGLEIIECFRGTNRVESYHKNLTVTFGRWSVGIRMSDCLLAERRHRHNQKCSERRRLDHPVTGHYNTWDTDLYQNLVRENHGIQLYPHWSNASDYIDTDESFDTIALQSAGFKIEEKSKEIGRVKLTSEQQYISDAMGTPLPLLPVVHEQESKAYASFVLNRKEGDDFETAAEDWMEYVNGVDVMPKLPSHLRTYDESFSRNTRVKESVRKANNESKKLEELNEKISPANVDDGSRWSEPQIPKPMPEPPAQALHKLQFCING
ncbi:LOW QUALITY PROTEIN: hypothetical protein ACHAWO_013615 [Cyclotella atomus]|uniref:Uncharacterized protein n=1 Tax=Cyclotella atomus TaxID=382360 RepID=A0ABD3PT10_9STRA